MNHTKSYTEINMYTHADINICYLYTEHTQNSLLSYILSTSILVIIQPSIFVGELFSFFFPTEVTDLSVPKVPNNTCIRFTLLPPKDPTF